MDVTKVPDSLRSIESEAVNMVGLKNHCEGLGFEVYYPLFLCELYSPSEYLTNMKKNFRIWLLFCRDISIESSKMMTSIPLLSKTLRPGPWWNSCP